MFIGHFGAGFAAKAVAPKVSLGSLFLAAQFIDLLWPTFLLLRIERVRIAPGITTVTPLDFEHYPFSHSLAGTLVWGLLLSTFYYSIRRDSRGSAILGSLVVSHWILDVIVHRPDLPLFPGSAQSIGFGLWSSLPGTLIIEFGLLGLGIWGYLRHTKSKDKIGNWALWSLTVFLAVIYLINVFGPPPPNVNAISWAGQAQWLLVFWGYWIDRHRFSICRNSKPSFPA